jgi:hypothetical protein
MPGQKNIRLAKKGAVSSLPDAGFRRFSPAFPLPPPLFAETKKGEAARFLPAFLASAPAFLPGQPGDRSERPTKSETIPKKFHPESINAEEAIHAQESHP